ncbi:SAM-dependent methyltransferase [Mycobacterium antarcticum]|uniref:SAM-dependent methyltransferase n=1 Tax=Mycolicibacterium sp. TUM20984 TaxID=3023368 RepID=UPI00238A9D7E|nr:methyltransferase domain-containing protein [Mycolicibacterium sp. TUM20984]GLP80935.1 hypothetical protein TUM20984_23550 [Mycolicibacterium sp. TUM20984]
MTYDETGLAGRVADQLDAAGRTDQLTTADTGLLDQYHAGGVDAVDKLIDSLGLRPGDTAIDVGSGFGGPARRIAEKTGATVLGLDITASYVETAQMLTRRTGLGDLVTFRHGDVMNFVPDRLFDAAITMHVQMNLADKVEWFAAIADVLAPGAKLGIWEVCLNDPERDPAWPMPWSLDGSDSHLVTPDELRKAITSAGFRTVEWSDETRWVTQWAATLGTRSTPVAGLVLPMLLDDGITRVVNLANALADGGLAVVRGMFMKPDTEGVHTR